MRILMVCLGNICRSPLAHGILENLAKENDLSWTVDSAGTGDWHVGLPPDERSIRVAQQNGIDISSQRAQLFTPVLFDQFDRILVMDRNNLETVTGLARTQEEKRKISLFLENDIVPDPYTDSTQFVPVFDLIAKRCHELLATWKGGADASK
ncbi:MAG: low molecular weight protein-tyrosine-phosphatase [Sphingobacterium sp.]